jgi:glycosyltransferase involved in cell wall biosynthesis
MRLCATIKQMNEVPRAHPSETPDGAAIRTPTTTSVLVPAYNEAATIIGTLERIKAQTVDGAAFQVIVVDDGSTDGTVALLESRPDLYGKLIRQPRNAGKGAAIKAGLREATGDYVLFQDADDEYDPADYAKLLLPVSRFGADLVMGSRLVAPEFTRVSYFWHRVGNRAITLVFNMLNNTTFTDIYSCYLMYKRDLLDPAELVADGWDQHAEILTRVAARAKSIYEVPISYHGRTYDEGKKIRPHHILRVVWTMIYRRFVR